MEREKSGILPRYVRFNIAINILLFPLSLIIRYHKENIMRSR